MRLYLVRHPQPLVPAGVCYGSSDVGVDRQALDRLLRTLVRPLAAAAVHAVSSLPHNLAIYSSPLRRCADFALQLARSWNSAVPTLDERLAEMHFGDWELRHWDDISRSEIDAWAADLVAYQPGGGESVLQMAKRVQAFYLDALRKQEDVIVVCHAGTIRILLACERSGDPEVIALHAAQNPIQLAYGQVVTLDVSRRSG